MVYIVLLELQIRSFIEWTTLLVKSVKSVPNPNVGIEDGFWWEQL